MPRNLMAALNQTPDGKAPKNPFDLMSFETFSQKGGQLNVVGVRDTVPNSDYRMSVDGFTRSIINNTANFARIKENYYFVHVPLGLISRNAYQTLVQRKEQYSALDFGITKFPYFDFKTVLSKILEVCNMSKAQLVANNMLDVHGFNIGFGALKLFDMLGYGSYQDIAEAYVSGKMSSQEVHDLIASFPDYKPTANRLAAYQCIWYHFFRNDIYDCDVSAKSFNFDDVTQATTGSEPSSDYDILSVRTSADFVRDCCQLRYVPYKKDIFMGSMPGTQFGPVSSVPINVDFSDLTASFTGNAVTPTGSFSGARSYATMDQVTPGGELLNHTSYSIYDKQSTSPYYPNPGEISNLPYNYTDSDEGRHAHAAQPGAYLSPYTPGTAKNDDSVVLNANGQISGFDTHDNDFV